MAVGAEETQIDMVETPSVGISPPWWEKPLLLSVLGLAVMLMVAWLAFLGWVASLLLFAFWP